MGASEPSWQLRVESRENLRVVPGVPDKNHRDANDATPYPPHVFGQQCDSAGVTGEVAVSAESKGLRGALETRF